MKKTIPNLLLLAALNSSLFLAASNAIAAPKIVVQHLCEDEGYFNVIGAKAATADHMIFLTEGQPLCISLKKKEGMTLLCKAPEVYEDFMMLQVDANNMSIAGNDPVAAFQFQFKQQEFNRLCKESKEEEKSGQSLILGGSCFWGVALISSSDPEKKHLTTENGILEMTDAFYAGMPSKWEKAKMDGIPECYNPGCYATSHQTQLFFFDTKAVGQTVLTFNRYDISSGNGWNPVIGKTISFTVNVVPAATAAVKSSSAQ